MYQELPNGLITQFTYDAQGNMSRQWDNAGRDKTYQYDQNGKLVQFIFNQDREVIAEQDSLEITRYIRSSELIARNTDAARTYYHYVSDEMGHIVDEDGIVLNHYDYDAWGNLTAQEEAVPNRFKFTGQQLDPVTQQYYLRARFYNPVIARFTQEDTYRGDGLNLYAYCQNNPVFYTDPSGYAAKAICDAKADAYRQKQANGEQLTRQEWEELRRYERAHNDPNYKLERDEGITPTDAYHRLHPNQPVKPSAEIPDPTTSTKRVGRWMSQQEYDKMVETGMVQERFRAIPENTANAGPK